MDLPFPNILLRSDFSIQAIGGTSDIMASFLIVFTITATIIFHRFWTFIYSLRRHLHFSFIFSNDISRWSPFAIHLKWVPQRYVKHRSVLSRYKYLDQNINYN